MSDTIIRVENLGKRYRIQHHAEKQRYTTLRDVITKKFKSLFHTRDSKPGTRNSVEDFWALKDLNFEIKQGEVVGVIGRNGAGKSTLLKILSRITEPTEGRVTLRGRVASLLEVGTGFHPELTGRENIFLNGAILGMHRAEIKRKFDEIVAFAEVEKFLDTPVKRYSSGMYVRLAFAVAAHLEPEILIVDEVLAVGDAEFQKKCLGKMQDASKSGRTVLFVSHNMATIQSLCPSSIILKGGRICFTGPTGAAVSEYLATGMHTNSLERPARKDGRPTLTKVVINQVKCRATASIDIQITVTSSVKQRCSLEILMFDSLGVPVGLASKGLLNPVESLVIAEGSQRFACRLELPRLARGAYRLNLQLAVPMVEVIDSTGDGLTFELHPEPQPGYERGLESNWGYGALEIPIHVERATA
jgi:lipopolysaccharide transport system ATP-binding protein